MAKPTEIREFMHKAVKLLSIFRTIAILLTASGLAHTAAQAAVATESLERIHATVMRFIEQQYPASEDLTIKVGRLDPRLRLMRCHNALESSWSPGSNTRGRATVSVHCSGARPWKLYVPVQITLLRNVAVANRLMTRGERIGHGDLVLEKRSMRQQQGNVILDPDKVQGYLLKQTLPAGRVLMARMLRIPKLVKRGHSVVLMVIGHSLNIRMKGIALDNGVMGESVKVRNPASERIMEGIVIAAGKVRISAP